MSAFSDASPSERYKISGIALTRMTKARKNAPFDWAAFAAMREQIAKEKGAKPSRLKSLLMALHTRLGRVIEGME